MTKYQLNRTVIGIGTVVVAMLIACNRQNHSGPLTTPRATPEETATDNGPGLTGPFGLDGRTVDPLGSESAKTTVFLFTRSDCPISNRYAPEIQRLHKMFASHGTQFYLVYPDPQETALSIREHLDDYGYHCTALRDPDHKLVALTGASITPEAAVFSSDGTMVYLGRIDDRFPQFGVSRNPATHELEDVLQALTTGNSVTPAKTQAIGCYIIDLK